MKVPVKWAGETPVLTLSNYLIKDHGIFSARILIHDGLYAGAWGAKDHGGKMFGKIVKKRSAGQVSRLIDFLAARWPPRSLIQPVS